MALTMLMRAGTTVMIMNTGRKQMMIGKRFKNLALR
jgi:hypothetical protein